MNRLSRCAATLVLLALSASLNLPATAAADPRPTLSQFTGTWRLAPSGDVATRPPPVSTTGPPAMLATMLPRFRPEIAEKILANLRPPGAGAPARRNYCAPPMFVGTTGYGVSPTVVLPFDFDMLASPGRVTLVNDVGLVRRVYLRDTPLPNALEESDAGMSIARMEGQTLVVRTTALNPDAQAVLGVPGTELGRNASVLERFTLMGADELEIVATVTAPDLYRAPVTSTNRYRRDPLGEIVPFSTCSTRDRAYDAAAGGERFDVTPPPDLPPPPP
jgi:hypothetical protein